MESKISENEVTKPTEQTLVEEAEENAEQKVAVLDGNFAMDNEHVRAMEDDAANNNNSVTAHSLVPENSESAADNYNGNPGEMDVPSNPSKYVVDDCSLSDYDEDESTWVHDDFTLYYEPDESEEDEPAEAEPPKSDEPN